MLLLVAGLLYTMIVSLGISAYIDCKKSSLKTT